jgi:peptide-methionine (S)-S-oxide reductase
MSDAGRREDAGRETATLAGGCFWCLEAAYEQLRGVERVESGYTGGHVENPSYRQVCTGETGHAEAVRITYDPAEVSYRDLLEVFFSIHDPTTLNRQGPDVGTQYRSAIFHETPEQRREAEAIIAELERERVFEAPIVTEIVAAGPFYPAEASHQEYYRNNPWQPYCRMVVAPKVAKFRQKYADRLKH